MTLVDKPDLLFHVPANLDIKRDHAHTVNTRRTIKRNRCGSGGSGWRIRALHANFDDPWACTRDRLDRVSFYRDRPSWLSGAHVVRDIRGVESNTRPNHGSRQFAEANAAVAAVAETTTAVRIIRAAAADSMTSRTEWGVIPSRTLVRDQGTRVDFAKVRESRICWPIRGITGEIVGLSTC